MELESGYLAQASSMNGFTAQEKLCGVQEYVPTLFHYLCPRSPFCDKEVLM